MDVLWGLYCLMEHCRAYRVIVAPYRRIVGLLHRLLYCMDVYSASKRA